MLFQERLALGWEIMWGGMVGIFAAIAVIVFAVWAFTKVGTLMNAKKSEKEETEAQFEWTYCMSAGYEQPALFYTQNCTKSLTQL